MNDPKMIARFLRNASLSAIVSLGYIEKAADAIEQLVKERDAAPVQHGHWKEIQVCRVYNEDTVYTTGYKCNQCGRIESKKEPYCNCS